MFGAGSGELVNCVFAENDNLLQEDYFSRGLVKIKNSIVDKAVNWQNCITTPVQFAASAQNQFLLDPVSLSNKNYVAATTDWMQANNLENHPAQPGIYAFQPFERTGSPK